MAIITETTFQESAPRVDAEAGVIYGVKLLGEKSKNGRRYTRKAMKEATSLYDGRKSYVNHPERDKLTEDRRFEDWSGIFRNVIYREGEGIFADQHLRKASDHFAGIIEAAQKFPTAVGYSHVANGETRMDGDTEIVESIEKVFSIDLVTDPATTGGFFESHKPLPTAELKQAAESLPASTAKTKLIEMLDADYGMATDAKADDPLSQMSALAKELITMLGETLKALAMKKNDAPPKPETDPLALAKPADEFGEQLPPDENDLAPQLESARRENAELKAKTLLLESGRDATPIRIKALASVADDAERSELLESWPKAAATERPLRSPAMVESVGFDRDFAFDNPEKFAARYR